MTIKKQADQTQTKTGKTFTGRVVSDRMTGTIVVSLDYVSRHPLYKKTVKKNKKLYSQNNLNAKKGDLVKIIETRPLSKLKRFITVEIIKKS